MPSVFLFRNDLRLTDNPALTDGARMGAVIPVYILPQEKSRWAIGSASKWWLHHSLASLSAALEKKGSRLILRRGNTKDVLKDLVRETRAERVLQNSPSANLLFNPETIKTGAGKPYQVFTPFWNACGALPPPLKPLPAPEKIPAPSSWPGSDKLEDWNLLPELDWADGFRSEWLPGEIGAAAALKKFIKHIPYYETGRNIPGVRHTSRLSPHLHFGEISARQVWRAVHPNGGDAYLREIGWRDFAYYLLHHFPHTSDEPLRSQYAKFPWRKDESALKAWKEGRTGYPIVDAGMRELWKTGWMHNRVRMVVSSFLVKDLLLSWEKGAEWFWDTLVDADLPNNTLGWQWSAGCGADAAPYFRIFNPVSQGERFDPAGTYVRKWVPEISKLASEWIHKPWDAPPAVLKEAGVVLGKNYPKPIVDHGRARLRALAAFKRL